MYWANAWGCSVGLSTVCSLRQARAEKVRLQAQQQQQQQQLEKAITADAH